MGKSEGKKGKGQGKAGGRPAVAGAEWAGLSVGELQTAAQLFLRCRNRRLRFGGSLDEPLTPAAMCGHLVAELNQYVSKLKPRTAPSQLDLAKRIDVNPGSFGKFLFGDPSKKQNWVAHARTLVRHLLRGEDAVAGPDRQPVIARFTDYFFREADPHVPDQPAYFLPSRQRFGEPCSRTELAGEIEWLAYEHQYTGRAVKCVWASGGSAFMPEGSTGKVGDAVKLAVDAGVRPAFVFHRPSAAAFNLDEFFSSRQIVPDGMTHALDLGGTGMPERWWEFLNPSLQFLFLGAAAPEDGRPDETLYILRGNEPNDDARARHGAIALEANQAELAAFKAWMTRMGL